jgi:hypothetical protein
MNKSNYFLKSNQSKLYFNLCLYLLLLATSIKLIPFAFDDAHIHFRISENLASHGQPFYNIGEKVMATSSPVWTYLLSLFSSFNFNLPIATAVINPLFTVLGSFIWTESLKKVDVSKKNLIFFQITYIGLMIPSCAGLMETPLAMLLLGTGIFFLQKKTPLSWIFISLAVFTRFEIIVFVPLGIIPFLFEKERYRHIIYLFLSLALLSALTFSTYGAIIPQTAKAKLVVYQLTALDTLRSVLSSIIPLDISMPYIEKSISLIKKILSKTSVIASNKEAVQKLIASTFFFIKAMAILTLIGFAGFLIRSISWKKIFHNTDLIRLLLISSGGLIVAIAYINSHVFLHAWYQPLFAVPILVLALLFATQNALVYRILYRVLLILPFILLGQYMIGSVSPKYLPTNARGARVQRYIQVGALLYSRAPSSRLMTSEIGGLGIGFKGYIHDGVGLITPDALKYHKIYYGTGGQIPPGYVNEKRPEFIVTYPIFAKRFAESVDADNYVKLNIPAFSASYASLIERDNIWGCKELCIYIRNDALDKPALDSLITSLRAL